MRFCLGSNVMNNYYMFILVFFASWNLSSNYFCKNRTHIGRLIIIFLNFTRRGGFYLKYRIKWRFEKKYKHKSKYRQDEEKEKEKNSNGFYMATKVFELIRVEFCNYKKSPDKSKKENIYSNINQKHSAIL